LGRFERRNIKLGRIGNPLLVDYESRIALMNELEIIPLKLWYWRPDFSRISSVFGKIVFEQQNK
jgi:hypothetical protein